MQPMNAVKLPRLVCFLFSRSHDVILCVMANPLGVLIANVLAPQLVKDPSHVVLLNIIVAIPSLIVCLLASAGVNRSRPKTPPTLSAATEQMKFLDGLFRYLTANLRKLFRNEDLFYQQTISHFTDRYGRWYRHVQLSLYHIATTSLSLRICQLV